MNDVRRVTVGSVAELEGLPPDFIASHPPAADGSIVLTTDYPDAFPVFDYARSDDLRRRMRVAFDSRAYPVNMALLDRLIARRAELAKLLGFASWADYATADKMVGSAARASQFIDQVAEASSPAASREYEMLLARKRLDDPSATVVNRWERNYLLELLRREKYQFDSQRIRPYFAYDSVKLGLLDLSAQLFGVTFKRMKDPPVWHESVEGYEMFEGGKLVGRFYLDMHPRPGKYKHAAQYDIRNGVAGERLPEAALLCNLPGGSPGDPGLMGHDDVVTLFHEFGHLMHTLLGGRQRWVGLGPSKVEWDFIEAPSQMLEEWTWDPQVLARFARHYQTGEPIPADLVHRMKQASELGRALQVRQQLAYARLSLSLYDRPPGEVNTDSITVETTREVHAVSARTGDALPDVVQPSRWVLGHLLHLHVVPGDREGHVQPVRPGQSPGSGARPALSRTRSCCPAARLRSACCWRDTSSAPSPSTPGAGGWTPATSRQLKGLRASQDLGRSPAILPSSPQVRPARAKKNATISANRTR